tara:strand:+ start:3660 stop:3800 length:141 start_codon:yes stop_codon:yes gene_type:complete
MNNWDKVEKKKRITTQQDINMIYFKTGLFVLVAIAYFYFVILGMDI